MKLRIRGNTVRLRLTRQEVATIAARGEVSERTEFGAGSVFRYCLRVDPAAAGVQAVFDDGGLCVTLPAATAADWAGSEQVGVEAEQPLDDGGTLRVTIEKDFACLVARAGEDDSDAYPHPQADG